MPPTEAEPLLLRFYWTAAFSLVAAVLAAWLIRRGLRGQSVGDHPVCRRCAYDLFALPAGAARCPECGADLAAPRATVRGGDRRPRPRTVLAGAACAAAALVGAILAARAGVRAWAFDANRPTWWLTRQIAADVPTDQREQASAELRRRLREDLLSRGQIDAITARVLDLQTGPSHSWRTGGFVIMARERKTVSDADWTRFASQNVRYDVSCRPRIAVGEALPVEIQERQLQSRSSKFWFDHKVTRVEVDGVPLPAVPDGAWPSPNLTSRAPYGPVGYYLEPALIARAGARPGAHTLTLHLDVSGGEYLPPNGPEGGPPALFRRQQIIHLPWTLLPAGAPTVDLIRSPQIDATVRAGTGPVEVECEVQHDGRPKVSVQVRRNDTSVTLSMSAELRAGARTWPAGESVSTPDTGGLYTTRVLPGFDADRVDVILRPAPDAGRQTVSVTEIWGGEITFKDVRVRWSDYQRTIGPPRPPGRRVGAQ